MSHQVNLEHSVLGWIQKGDQTLRALNIKSTHSEFSQLRHLASPFEILLRGVYHFFPDSARWIARTPLHIYPSKEGKLLDPSSSQNEFFTPADWGLLKTAGKNFLKKYIHLII